MHTISGSSTRLDGPDGMAFDSAGNLYVGDVYASAILVFAAGTLETFSDRGDRWNEDQAELAARRKHSFEQNRRRQRDRRGSISALKSRKPETLRPALKVSLDR